MPKLRAEAMSLAELLARYSNYTVPDFQRVYGWGEPQIKRLLSDLESAIERGGWLYLGDIYLASEPKSSQAEIADGQQRIATLSMFCAAGRDLAEDAAEADRLHALLVAPGANRGVAAYRYAPRDLDVAFFRRWVQEPGATRRHPAVNDAEEDVDGADQPLSESQTNIIVNRDLIVQKLESFGPAGRGKLFSFLDASAEVTVHTADKLEDVRYAYASTHSRGLAQAEVDKLKAELLGDCRQDVRHRLATLWEDCEARLGKERLADLLGALVFVEAERKPQLSLEADLAKVFGLPANVQKFIEKTLVPSALAYERILAASKGQRAIRRATPNGRRLRRIDGHLVTLMRTSHDTWKGPAILALRTLRDKALENFLRDLERLAAVLMIVGVEPNKVFQRYGEVVRELKGNGPAKGSALDIEAELLGKARVLLGGDRFGGRERERFRMPVLLKVNDLLKGDVVTVNPRRVSCEHVLPRNGGRTRWNRLFRHPERGYVGAEYANRLGNLAILTHEDNRTADTKPYEVKRKILKASGFALSKDAAKEKAWTAAVIEARTERLLQILVAHWRLK
jgi:Protein of unknown function DUF262/Protein of unknown function (DUF1524)